MWFVELESPNKKKRFRIKVQVTTFNDEKDLGVFLQNYDRNKYKIVRIKKVFVKKISESMDFIKKEENLEYGKKEEKK